MDMIVRIVISALAVIISSYIIPGVSVLGFMDAVLAAIVLGIVNLVIRPLILLFTLPLNILTLGLFTLVVNAFMVLIVAKIVPGFNVSGLLSAFLFSLVLSIVSTLIFKLFK